MPPIAKTSLSAFVAAIDNEELEDVDLFEITDPRNPVLLAETRLATYARELGEARPARQHARREDVEPLARDGMEIEIPFETECSVPTPGVTAPRD